jgi:hypothetical protein
MNSPADEGSEQTNTNSPAKFPHFPRAKQAMKRTPEADLARAAADSSPSTAGARSKPIPSPAANGLRASANSA